MYKSLFSCSIMATTSLKESSYPHNQPEASAPHGALARHRRLLAVVGFDHLLDLLLYRVQVEGSRVLHRRVFDGRLG